MYIIQSTLVKYLTLFNLDITVSDRCKIVSCIEALTVLALSIL